MKDFRIEFLVFSYEDKSSGTIDSIPECTKFFYRKAESMEQIVKAIKNQKSVKSQLIEFENNGPTKSTIHLDTEGMENVAHYWIEIIQGIYDKETEVFEPTTESDIF